MSFVAGPSYVAGPPNYGGSAYPRSPSPMVRSPSPMMRSLSPTCSFSGPTYAVAAQPMPAAPSVYNAMPVFSGGGNNPYAVPQYTAMPTMPTVASLPPSMVTTESFYSCPSFVQPSQAPLQFPFYPSRESYSPARRRDDVPWWDRADQGAVRTRGVSLSSDRENRYRDRENGYNRYGEEIDGRKQGDRYYREKGHTEHYYEDDPLYFEHYDDRKRTRGATPRRRKKGCCGP